MENLVSTKEHHISSEIKIFLDGLSTSPGMYLPQRWNHISSFPADDYTIEDVLNVISDKTVSRQIIPGRKNKKSAIHNFVGLYDKGKGNMAVKIGEFDAISDNTDALKILSFLLITPDPGISTVATQLYRLKGSRIGLRSTPYIEGELYEHASQLKNFQEPLQWYFNAKVGYWLFSAFGRYPNVFTDVFSPGNTVIEQNELVIIDADFTPIRGKFSWDEQWISGDIATEITREMNMIGYRPEDFRMNYDHASKKLFFPEEVHDQMRDFLRFIQ